MEELVSAEFGRMREFLVEEEERIKEKLQKQKEEKLQQLEEALTQSTEQISQLEITADKLRLKLREEENPEQLKVRGEGFMDELHISHNLSVYFANNWSTYKRILNKE